MEFSAIIGKLTTKHNLSPDEAQLVMDSMVTASFTPAQTAALLVALKMKGETAEEIAEFAKVMRKHCVKISPKAAPLVDTCGTGGDSSHTFNISTAAGIIAASAGVKIAKHGNRSVSGKCGSADVLEALGVKMLPPAQVEKCIDETGFGFMFAPSFHPAMKNVMPVRKELGVRTAFNMLGPLTNPAGADRQVLGVFEPGLVQKMAEVLSLLGSRHALVVHSEGMDEIGLGRTEACEIINGKLRQFTIDASEFSMQKRDIPKVHSIPDGAKALAAVLSGNTGAALDISLLNAAAAIYVSGKAASIKEGLAAAKQAVASGDAQRKLEEIKAFSA